MYRYGYCKKIYLCRPPQATRYFFMHVHAVVPGVKVRYTINRTHLKSVLGHLYSYLPVFVLSLSHAHTYYLKRYILLSTLNTVLSILYYPRYL